MVLKKLSWTTLMFAPWQITWLICIIISNLKWRLSWIWPIRLIESVMGRQSVRNVGSKEKWSIMPAVTLVFSCYDEFEMKVDAKVILFKRFCLVSYESVARWQLNLTKRVMFHGSNVTNRDYSMPWKMYTYDFYSRAEKYQKPHLFATLNRI